MNRHPAQRWANVWRSGWETRDVAAIAALYAPDAVFHSQPFRAAHHGPAGVREYVTAALADEADVRARFGDPLIDGDRAAVEWWATLREAGTEITLAGTSVLRFGPDGLVAEQRDTWNQQAGHHEPPAGWGSAPGRDSLAVATARPAEGRHG